MKREDSLQDEPALSGGAREKLSTRDSIANEPFFNQAAPALDPLESVWQEPGFSGGAGKAEYARFLAEKRRAAPPWKSWPLLPAIMLASAPLAIVLVFWTQFRGSPLLDATQAPGIIVLAPLVEEIGKIALPLIVVETRP